MNYIYGLDLSLSNSGIAIFSNDAHLVALLSIDTHSEKEHGKKLKLIGKQIIKLKKKYPPEKIVFERGFSRFAASTEAIFKVVGLCQYLFCDIEQIFYSPMTVKKIVAGKGNMKKDEVYRSVSKYFPETLIEDFDQSDALAVGLCYFISNNIIVRKEFIDESQDVS
jgi:crossover junction endodeoxyribonuclease RuvC